MPGEVAGEDAADEDWEQDPPQVARGGVASWVLQQDTCYERKDECIEGKIEHDTLEVEERVEEDTETMDLKGDRRSAEVIEERIKHGVLDEERAEEEAGAMDFEGDGRNAEWRGTGEALEQALPRKRVRSSGARWAWTARRSRRATRGRPWSGS